MSDPDTPKPGRGAARNIALYPWFKFLQNLLFWQAVWFLFFQSELSAAQAVLLYAVYDVATTTFEVPSGYMSDRLGRRITLLAATLAGILGAGLIALGSGFAVFVLAQVLLGMQAAFASGTDSALLYESLAENGQADQVERAENRAWRFTLSGLALSAITGGALAQISFAAAFGAGALATCGAFVVVCLFKEPARSTDGAPTPRLREHVALFGAAMRNGVLVWLFALSVLMYGFSHLPFVFGQPFIADALSRAGWQAEAPLVSGTVTAVMMGLSVLASLCAVALRRAIGLPALLLLAFGMQITLIGVLALTPSLFAIAMLFLRMVPDSLARPFMVARMQPLLSDAGRATYLSMQSFVGRLLFAGSLLFVSSRVPTGSTMAHTDISGALGCYTLAGVVFLGVLWAGRNRSGV